MESCMSGGILSDFVNIIRLVVPEIDTISKCYIVSALLLLCEELLVRWS